MNKILLALVRWFSKKLDKFTTHLERLGNTDQTKPKFVNLAPTDLADKDGVYSQAIHFATSDAQVKNIALTGPYGSGKSSIIQSFLTKHRPKALHISLAAFVPDEDVVSKDVTRQEIERSILQQMLYGADANKLPLSRFKRIQSPGIWSIFTSLNIVIGITSLWYVLHHRGSVFDGSYFDPLDLTNWENLGIFSIATLFLWTTLHHFYVASFGVSLKSVSLKDIEMRPAADDQESILNRHLDEIIYFFQATDYKLVIIEDLDRFNDPEIFTTLREINSLVNANAGVKRTIRFLYALRDDMFVNTDRTKFFEFIIPVIPIINSSNSIDMVLEQGKRLEIDKRFNRQFLREVSRYLNDLRLIQNIFNEYAIYSSNLESGEENFLDANKLLAILIYKNVHPKDFEQLHRGVGNFAEILNRKDMLIVHGEAACRAEISALELQIRNAEIQTPSDLKELRQVYAMALIERLPPNTTAVGLNSQTQILLSNIVEHNTFEQLIEQQNVTCRLQNNSTRTQNISNFQNEVDPQRSYQVRKGEIEFISSENQQKSLSRIKHLRSKISKLRTTKLSELLRTNMSAVAELFQGFNENTELAKYLILEGHLDDTYYQYTSLFHSGRLSPNDNKFLIQIRAFTSPEPQFPIDNPNEVIAAMREDDFGQNYVLNVGLINTLLSAKSRYSEQVRKLLDFLSSEFEGCEEFFSIYYSSGTQVTGLLSGLANTWKGLVPAAIASPQKITHVTQLIACLPDTSLKKLAEEFPELPEFVSMNLPAVLAHASDLPPERLQCLGFEIKDMTAIQEYPEIARFMFERGLFELTIDNLEYAYTSILGETDLESLRMKNFTTICSLNNESIVERINRNFDMYVSDVLLELPNNSNEDTCAILSIIGNDDLDQEILRRFLDRQTTLLPSLEGVPERLSFLLFKLNVIEPSWENCLSFMGRETFEAEVLVEYLDQDSVRSVIMENPIPDDPESKKLSVFLVKAGSLSDAAYGEYARALPRPFDFVPENLENSKLEILIQEEKLNFTVEIFEALSGNRILQVLFVAINIEAYLAETGTFPIDDIFREELLRSNIDQVWKVEVVKLMDLAALVGLPDRSALIGPIINKEGANSFNLDANIVRTLIEHSRPVAEQVSLLNKCHSLMSDDEVRQILSILPTPFSEIKTGYGIPRLRNNPENLELVTFLDSRDIISSWSESSFFSNDIRVNLYRR